MWDYVVDLTYSSKILYEGFTWNFMLKSKNNAYFQKNYF